jgi:type VI secretion system protein ImpM
MKIGFFGKLPGYGDFVQRNVNPAIIDYWDNWLTQSIDASQYLLGDGWKETFFNSPIWRFHIQGNVVVADAISGLIMPSVDSAGRCYPFVVVCQIKPHTNVFTLASKIDSFHASCEEFSIGLLEQQRPDLDEIVQWLQTNYAKLSCNCFPDTKPNTDTNNPELYRSIEQHSSSIPEVHETFLAHVIAQHCGPISIWHTTQNSHVKKQHRYYQGMPPVDAFASLLRGE